MSADLPAAAPTPTAPVLPPSAPTPAPTAIPAPHPERLDLFLVSLLILFLELACIRWFPAHVLFLTFFTNVVLLACFVGMSVGCLCASHRRRYLNWTPLILVVAIAAAFGVEALRTQFQDFVDVGNQRSPAFVFFGTEYRAKDVASFVVPIEVVGGVFFLLLALTFIGPGQELGRAFNRVANRVSAYTLNIVGSLAGIALFAAFSYFEWPPVVWFLPAVGLIAYLLRSGPPSAGAAAPASLLSRGVRWLWLLLALALVTVPELVSHEPKQERQWSPYYRIDYMPDGKVIRVNLIGHQQMIATAEPHPAYALPHAIGRDAGVGPFRDVLIIGAGSGNDVARALQWGAEHIDAVEIDPAIYRLGRRDHPDRPYDDPRVHVHLDDGRNFLRATDRHYDLVVYALVDSLVLHSSYSNIRLESYLFTEEAFRDVGRRLKPGGVFAMYNFFRQGWIVTRLRDGLKSAFGAEPLVMTWPYRRELNPTDSFSDTTLFLAGSEAALKPLRAQFEASGEFWVPAGVAPKPGVSPNGFLVPAPVERQQATQAAASQESGEVIAVRDAHGVVWWRLGLADVKSPVEPLRTATDDWPFLYLRAPGIPPRPTLAGMLVMAVLAAGLIFLFTPRSAGGRGWPWEMFFLGAGFMLMETKAVVHMALLFGSTWMINSIVFFAVLVMILLANLFVLRVAPTNRTPYYIGLIAALAANVVVPLDFFLGLERGLQIVGACTLVFTPIFFAGVIFASAFKRTSQPDRAFGANIAGSMLGGLAENTSLLFGFRSLLIVAIAFYALARLTGWREDAKR